MPRPRTLPPEVRRKAIIDAGRKAMAKRGYQDLRLDEVASLAGVAKGTLYLYFKDKMDLLAGVFQDLCGQIDDRIRSIPPSGSARGRLARAVRIALEFADEYESFFGAGFSGGHPDLMRSKAGKRIRDCHLGHLKLVGSLLRDCVKEGSLRRHDTMMGALLFDKTLLMFIDLKKLQAGGEPLSARRKDFVDILLKGLGKG